MNLLISERDAINDEHIYGNLVKFSQKVIDYLDCERNSISIQYNKINKNKWKKIKYVS